MSNGKGWFLGKTVNQFINALKPQPLLLALVSINMLTLVLIYYTTMDMRERYGEIITKLIDACKRVVGNLI